MPASATPEIAVNSDVFSSFKRKGSLRAWARTKDGHRALRSLTLEQVQRFRATQPSVLRYIADETAPALPILGVIGGSLCVLPFLNSFTSLPAVAGTAVLAVALGGGVGRWVEARMNQWAQQLTVWHAMAPLSDRPDLWDRCFELLKHDEVKAYRDAVVARRELVLLDCDVMEGLAEAAIHQKRFQELRGAVK